MSHARPGEPVELGDVQRLDLAREMEREGVVEAAARAVLAAGDIQLLDLELRRDVFVVAGGGVMAQPTLVVGREWIVDGRHRRDAKKSSGRLLLGGMRRRGRGRVGHSRHGTLHRTLVRYGVL
jgi:hypothetical protein